MGSGGVNLRGNSESGRNSGTIKWAFKILDFGIAGGRGLRIWEFGIAGDPGILICGNAESWTGTFDLGIRKPGSRDVDLRGNCYSGMTGGF